VRRTRVFATQYVAIELLFHYLRLHRQELGVDFEHLRHLAFEWAYVRPRVEIVEWNEQFEHSELDVEEARTFIDAWMHARVPLSLPAT